MIIFNSFNVLSYLSLKTHISRCNVTPVQRHISKLIKHARQTSHSYSSVSCVAFARRKTTPNPALQCRPCKIQTKNDTTQYILESQQHTIIPLNGIEHNSSLLNSGLFFGRVMTKQVGSCTMSVMANAMRKKKFPSLCTDASLGI